MSRLSESTPQSARLDQRAHACADAASMPLSDSARGMLGRLMPHALCTADCNIRPWSLSGRGRGIIPLSFEVRAKQCEAADAADIPFAMPSVPINLATSSVADVQWWVRRCIPVIIEHSRPASAIPSNDTIDTLCVAAVTTRGDRSRRTLYVSTRQDTTDSYLASMCDRRCSS